MAISRGTRFSSPLARLRQREVSTAATILFFLVSRWWVLVVFSAPVLGDLTYYREWARLSVDCRFVPYRDYSVEYPPLAFWVMEIPRLLDTKTYRGAMTRRNLPTEYLRHYVRWYRMEMLLCDVVCFCLLFGIGARLLSRSLGWVLPAAYALLTIAQPHLMHNVLDLGLAMLLAGAVWCWLQSLGSRSDANAWCVGAYLCLGLGTSYKLIPAVLFPFLLLADWRTLGWTRSLAGRAAVFAAAALGPFLYYVPTAGCATFCSFSAITPTGAFTSIRFGGCGPGGSLCGSAVRATRTIWLRRPGQLLDADVEGLPTGRVVVERGLLFAWAVLQGSRYTRRVALDLAILALVDAAVLSHVFSLQYLNWFLPMVLILACDVLSRKWFPWLAVVAMSAIAVGVSTWIFPSHASEFFGLLHAQPLALAILQGASLAGLAVILSACFFRRMAERDRQSDAATAGLFAVE